MARKTRISLTALATALIATAPAGAETLKEAMAVAYDSNPDLLAARAFQRSLDEQVPQAIAGWMPRVTGQFQQFYSKNKSKTLRLTDGTFVNDNTFSGSNQTLSANADIDFFRGFRNFNALGGAKATVEAGRANLLLTEQNVLFDAVNAYMDVLRDEAVLRLNENNVKVLKRQLEATEDRFRVGEVTRTDVAQAEAAVAGAESQRIQAEATLATSRATYRRVIGNFPGSLESDPPPPPLPGNEEDAVEIALEENPAVVAARFEERAARFDVAEAKGAVLPTFSGFYRYNRGNRPSLTFDPQQFGFVGASNFFRGTQVGVSLTVPLYQSGAEYAEVRRQKQVRSQRVLQIMAAERQVMRDVRVAWENYRAAQARIESTQAQVRANEIAVEGARQESTVGARTVLDVLQTEQVLLDSQVNLVSARRDEYVAAFALLQAIGRLNAVALGLPVEIYDPTGYYEKVKYRLIGWGTPGPELVPKDASD
ncbi:MAG: TolC family outer membrane protein [Rhodothalassiaceae bacterium]